MNRRSEYLLLATHAGGVVLLSALAAALAVTALAPWQQRAADRPRLKRALEETSERCAHLIQVNQDHAATLHAAVHAAEREERRCNITDSQLMALVNAHCGAGGVSLESIEPQPAVRGAAWRDVQIRGQGRFTALHRVLAALEAESPYLQITSLRIEGPLNLTGDTMTCGLMWTLRWVPPAAPAAAKPAGAAS